MTRYLGTTDDVTTCDCCGRAGLKSTVAVLIGESADPVYYGVTCAARALRVTAKEVRSEARAADAARDRATRAAAQAGREREYVADQALLDAWFPALAGNRFEQVRALYAEGRSFEDLRAARSA